MDEFWSDIELFRVATWEKDLQVKYKYPYRQHRSRSAFVSVQPDQYLRCLVTKTLDTEGYIDRPWSNCATAQTALGLYCSNFPQRPFSHNVSNLRWKYMYPRLVSRETTFVSSLYALLLTNPLLKRGQVKQKYGAPFSEGKQNNFDKTGLTKVGFTESLHFQWAVSWENIFIQYAVNEDPD